MQVNALLREVAECFDRGLSVVPVPWTTVYLIVVPGWIRAFLCDHSILCMQ